MNGTTVLTPSDFLRLRHPIHLCGTDPERGLACEVAVWEEDCFRHAVVLWREKREIRFSFPQEDCVEPQLSPDGGMLAFIRRGESGARLYLYDTASRKLESVETYRDVTEAVWHPDGQTLCLLCGQKESRMLLYTPRTGEERLLRQEPAPMHRAAFSADGRRIAYISAADGEKPRCVDAVSGESVLLSERVFQPVKLNRPLFSADGERVLCLGFSMTGEDELHHLFCLRADGGGEIALRHTGDVPQEVSPLYADGESLPNASAYMAACGADRFLVIGARGGRTGIYRIELGADGTAVWTCLYEDRCCISGICAGGALISTAQRPFEVYTLAADGTPACLSRENGWIEGKALYPAVCVREENGHETAWGIFLPKGGEKRPAVLLIHGGPACYFSGGFSLEQQLLAGAGYDVLFANPHGSTGYGAAYAESKLAFDGTAERELLSLLRGAAAGDHGIDPARLAVMGGSYGGFMSAWLIGHHGDFKAACVLRALLGGEGMQLLAGIDEKEMQRIAQGVRIPTLVMHGEEDPICLLRYSQEYYRALGSAQKRFVSFPGARHSVGELSAADAERFYTEILDWWRGRL